MFLRLLLIVACIFTTGFDSPTDNNNVKTIWMPTRDGKKLKTTIYHNTDFDLPLPVLLLKTAYDGKNFENQARRVANRGYIAVIQDSRGRFGSEGEFRLYWNEAPDGFDTITWIKEQDWCDGHVGMWGPSYMGSVQWLTASTGAPLNAIAPTASVTYFHHNIYRGGASIFALVRAGFGANVYGPPPSAGASPNWVKWYLTLPLMDIDDVVGYEAPLQMNMIKHFKPDGFWKETDARNFSDMNLPAQHIVGYYDFMCPGSIYAYQKMRTDSPTKYSRNNQQLILGPWDHATGSDRSGDVVFGETARLDTLGENLKWYDRWFKGVNSNKPDPRVRYFVMGDNEWRTAEDWPPSASQLTPFFLHSSGDANSKDGDGALSQETPDVKQSPDSFRSDPNHPVPNAPAHGIKYVDGFGPYDEHAAHLRDDVLVYQSQPVTEPLSFAGQISAILYISADTPDADFVVKVVDIYPNGFCHPLSTGILRASARNSLMHRELLKKDKTYKITVDVGHCAATIKPGHRLCIQIQGTHFPVYDRNTNTGEGPFSKRTLISTQTVFHDANRQSHVLLPIIK